MKNGNMGIIIGGVIIAGAVVIYALWLFTTLRDINKP
jgi:hypothetical protein